MSPAGWPLDGPAEIVHNGCPSNLSTTTPLPRLACLPVVSASPPLYRQLRDGSLTWLTINVCAGSDWVPRPGGQTAEKPFVAGGGTRHGHWSGFLRATSTSQHAMLFAMACFVFHVISDRGMERGGVRAVRWGMGTMQYRRHSLAPEGSRRWLPADGMDIFCGGGVLLCATQGLVVPRSQRPELHHVELNFLLGQEVRGGEGVETAVRSRPLPLPGVFQTGLAALPGPFCSLDIGCQVPAKGKGEGPSGSQVAVTRTCF